MDRDIEHLNKSLNFIFNNSEVTPSGQVVEKRYLVGTVKNLKIVIHPNEHPPPHFHVLSDEINASIDVITCELLRGEIKNSDMKKIKYWHSLNSKEIIRVWNLTRPSDCPVGRIEQKE